MSNPASGRPRVGLFVTCLVDLIRPSIGFAAVKLIEEAGCTIEVPVQTCCGQPAFNSGDRLTTRDLAERVIEAFRDVDYVVAPSGSCAGMIRVHYPELFADDPNWAPKAAKIASKTRAAGSRCRPRRPAAASRPSIPATGRAPRTSPGR